MNLGSRYEARGRIKASFSLMSKLKLKQDNPTSNSDKTDVMLNLEKVIRVYFK